ncbi:MAG: hypothetical protein ACI96M_004072, partial [Candidatus Azotimanducaceae bacterium]
GNHQGQRPCASREQAEHKTAFDKTPRTKKGLAKREPSTQDKVRIRRTCKNVQFNHIELG